MTVPSVPFTIEPSTQELMSGSWVVEGLVLYEPGTLRFEYRRLGFKESGIQRASLTLAQIQEISMKTGWVVDRLRIRGRTLVALESLPGASSVDKGLVLKFKRRHRDDLRTLYDRVRLDHSEWRLNELDLLERDELNPPTP